MRTPSRLAPSIAMTLLLAACGDDDDGRRSSEGGGGAAPATTATTTSSTASSGGGEGGAPGAGGGGAGGAGGGTTSPACGDGLALQDLDDGAWDARFTIAGFTGHDGFAPAVHDLAVDVDGSVVAAGRFQWLDGAPIPPLMRHRDGVWEPARATWEIAPPLDGFSAVALGADGALALATNDSFGERDGSIWIDDGDGLRAIGDFTGQVRSLAWWGGELWVAGLFAIGDDTPIEGLAVWDGAVWSTPPGGPLVPREDGGAAFEILAEDDGLVVAGAFAGVGGVPAVNVASFDGGAWTALDFDDAMVVYALARTASGVLHAGGAYGAFDAPSGVARWTGAAWETVGGGLGQYATRGVVTDLAVDGEVVDATGCFSTAGGLMGDAGAVPSRGVARWDGAAWTSLDDGEGGAVAPWFQPFVCGDEGLTAVWDVPHQRLARDGERLFAGGFFAGVDGVLSQSIAVHDGEAWTAQGGDDGLGVGGSLDRVVAAGEGCVVWGLGVFTHLAGEPTGARVARWDGDGWTALPDPLPRDAFCPAIAAADDGTARVGCMVFPLEGDAEGVVLAPDGDTMAPLDLDLPGPVTALAIDGGTLWIAGTGPTSWLARVADGETTLVADDLDAPINALDVAGDDDVLVAGAFTTIGGVDASRIARWDGASWTALGDGLPGQVLALARDGATAYASSYDEGAGAFLLGAFDLEDEGAAWRELAGPETGVTPQEFFSLDAIRPVDGGLVVAGTIELDDGSGRGALLFDGATFRPLGGGVRAMGVQGLALTPDAVWVGGTIAEVGADAGKIPSIGVARWITASSVAP